MRTYVLTPLSDAVLLRNLNAIVAHERTATADVLAHIAEVDTRRLFLPAGFPSMRDYCVGVLHFSEDAAYKRIQAARAGRDFPVIFPAVAEGRLHLVAVCLLAPHLTPENVDGLLTEAAHKSKADIELLVARRFPRTEMMTLVHALPASPTRQSDSLAPGQVESDTPEGVAGQFPVSLAPGQVTESAPRSQVKPLAPERFALQMTITKATYDKLQYVQQLMSHRLPSGDLAQVIDRALDALVRQLEKRKFAATDTPRPCSGRSSADPRHIPANVKRAVRERDQGKCAFASDTGQCCGSRMRLEFDHIVPVALGGEATVDNTRLLCRAHNQYEAECTFGSGFMNDKREQAEGRKQAAIVDEQARAKAAEAQERSRVEEEHARDLTASLRGLGYGHSDTQRAIEFCRAIPDATTLEGQVRAALAYLCPRVRRVSPEARA